jgi:hypothetical protein
VRNDAKRFTLAEKPFSWEAGEEGAVLALAFELKPEPEPEPEDAGEAGVVVAAGGSNARVEFG